MLAAAITAALLALSPGSHGAPGVCTVSWHAWVLPDGTIVNDGYGYKVSCDYRRPERRRGLS